MHHLLALRDRLRSTPRPRTPVPPRLRSAVAGLAVSALAGAVACGPTSRLDETSRPELTVLSHEQQLRLGVAEVAREYIGAPYVYGAKGPRSFDCSGFTRHLMRRFDVALNGSSMSQAKQGRRISPQRAQPGDIVYFANEGGRVNHVAVVVCNGPSGLEVVHATTSRGVVRDNVSKSSYWAPRLAGAREVVDVRQDFASAY